MKILLAQYIAESNINISELANRINISRQSLHKIINGTSIMHTETFYRLHGVMEDTGFKQYARALELEYKEQLRKKYKTELKILGM